MKTVALLGLLLFATLNSASQVPDEYYTVSVHVNSSYLLPYADTRLELKVVINGKKYELREEGGSSGALLAPGDYKARLIKDEHKAPYLSVQIYELLFPDKKVKKFYVSGNSE